MRKYLSERFAGIRAFHLAYTLPNPVGWNSFVCHSLVLSEAEVIRKHRGVGLFLPFWLALSTAEGFTQRDLCEGNSNDNSPAITNPLSRLNSPNRRTAPSCGTSRSAHPAIPGAADSSAPPVVGPALHPGTAPPLQSPCALRPPALPRFRPQCPALSNPSP